MKFHKYVQKHVPVGLPIDPLLDRQQASSDLGQAEYFPSYPVHNGHIKRITDQDIQSSVLEIMGTNVTTAFITCPQNEAETLGIKLPFLVMIIKNVRMPSFSSRNTSPLRCRCSMIKTSGGASGHPTTNPQPESSPLSVPCP